MSMLKKFERWFDLNLGWFFVSGRKQDAWREYIRKKHGSDDKQH